MREAANLPAPARDDGNFEIPHGYSMLVNGEQFLRYDNNNGEARILIYATESSISFLANSDDWFMDGTFSVAPPQFTLLYTIHGLRNVSMRSYLTTRQRLIRSF